MRIIKENIQVDIEEGYSTKAYISPLSYTPEVEGCPLGRGDTVQSAIKDLRYRIRIESNIDLIPNNIKIVNL